MEDEIQKQLLEGFFEHLLIVKMFHFQTNSGFRHLKCDDHMTTFLGKLDRFFEVCQGEYEKLSTTSIKISFKTRNDDDFDEYLDQFANWLLVEMGQNWPATLIAIRDDIVADIRKLQYLIDGFE